MGRLRRELRFLEHGVEELEAEVGVQINSQMTQEEKERCEELTSSVPKSPIYRRAPVGRRPWGRTRRKLRRLCSFWKLEATLLKEKRSKIRFREKKQLKNLSRLKRLLRIWREKTKAWD